MSAIANDHGEDGEGLLRIGLLSVTASVFPRPKAFHCHAWGPQGKAPEKIILRKYRPKRSWSVLDPAVPRDEHLSGQVPGASRFGRTASG